MPISAALRPDLLFAAAMLSVLVTSASAEQDRPAQVTIGTDVGQMYPDFLLPSLGSELGRLGDYRGRKVLLLHFASW